MKLSVKDNAIQRLSAKVFNFVSPKRATKKAKPYQPNVGLDPSHCAVRGFFDKMKKTKSSTMTETNYDCWSEEIFIQALQEHRINLMNKQIEHLIQELMDVDASIMNGSTVISEKSLNAFIQKDKKSKTALHFISK